MAEFSSFSFRWSHDLILLAAAAVAYPFQYSEIHLSNNTQPGSKTIRQALYEGATKGGVRNVYRGFMLNSFYVACLNRLVLGLQSWIALSIADSKMATPALAASSTALDILSYPIVTVWKRMVMSSQNERPY